MNTIYFTTLERLLRSCAWSLSSFSRVPLLGPCEVVSWSTLCLDFTVLGALEWSASEEGDGTRRFLEGLETSLLGPEEHFECLVLNLDLLGLFLIGLFCFKQYLWELLDLLVIVFELYLLLFKTFSFFLSILHFSRCWMPTSIFSVCSDFLTTFTADFIHCDLKLWLSAASLFLDLCLSQVLLSDCLSLEFLLFDLWDSLWGDFFNLSFLLPCKETRKCQKRSKAFAATNIVKLAYCHY